MSADQDGGNAFPSTIVIEGPNFDPIKKVYLKEGYAETYIQMGMTLRDYFAAKAMAPMVQNRMVGSTQYGNSQDIAARAYEIADAMLKERAK